MSGTKASRSHSPVGADIGGAAPSIVLGEATAAPGNPQGKSGLAVPTKIIGWNLAPGHKVWVDPGIPIAEAEFGNLGRRNAGV